MFYISDFALKYTKNLMKIYKLFLVIVFFPFSIFCYSQNLDSVSIDKISSNLKISYNSSLIFPGIRFGIESIIRTAHVIKQNKSSQNQDFVKDWLLSVNLSWYHHPDFHDNIYLTAGWTMRRTKSKGFLTEFSPETGISRTFLGGTTYKVDNNGNITIEKHAGYYYAFLSVGGGFGYDFSKTKSKPFLAFGKLNVLMMFPYNNTIYLRPALEIGIIYKPPHFLSFKVKSKIIDQSKSNKINQIN